MKRDLLHAPAGDFGGHDFIGIPAIHRVYGGEFLGQLARLAKFAQDRSIQFHLVNFTGDRGDVGIIVIGI